LPCILYFMLINLILAKLAPFSKIKANCLPYITGCQLEPQSQDVFQEKQSFRHSFQSPSQ
jgi:hypothetical protein